MIMRWIFFLIVNYFKAFAKIPTSEISIFMEESKDKVAHNWIWIKNIVVLVS
jgi:hypothetical protein